MSRVYIGCFTVCLFATCASAQLIIDHNCVDIAAIPSDAVAAAKEQLHIAYGHTSHGSQLTVGMSGLVGFANGGGKGLSAPTDFYAWNNGGSGGALDLHDYAMGVDVGYYPQWVQNTTNYLNNPANSDVNVIMWSWCGQVDDKYSAGTLTNEYLAPMAQLETEYPGVTFVYMTGHVDIWDDVDNKAANNAIRQYCQMHGKVLYDFADIERYDPDGTYFEFVSDGCDYYDAAGGTRLGNWATEWQVSHIENVDWYDCGAAHSVSLNANQKAYAAWWMFARLAGWGGPIADTTPPSVPQNLTAVRVDIGEVELAWNPAADAESGVSGYRLLRNGTQLATPSVTNYVDQTAVPGSTNKYAVLAVNGAGLFSATSTPVTVIVPADETAPSIPADLSGTAVSDSQVNLNWSASTDNVAVAGYRVFRDGTEIGTTASTAYSDTGLTGNSNYNYSVSAFDTSGNESATCTPVNVSTPLVDNEPPTTPTGLGVISTSCCEVVIGWNPSTDNVAVSGYRVFRDGTQLNTATGTSFSDGSVIGGATYAYQVSAFDGSGNESATSAVLNVTVPNGGVIFYTNRVESTSEVIDTFMRESEPDTNFGNSGWINPMDRFLARFDLPSAAQGKRIVSATLNLFVWGQTNYQTNQFMTVHRITAPWTESGATWNERSAGTVWTVPGGDFDTNIVAAIEHQPEADHVLYPPADVRYQVQKWVCGAEPNYGFIVLNEGVTGISFKASEYSTHGYLEIVWLDEAAPYLFECWQTNYFTQAEINNPAIAGKEADPDGDGLNNGFEHALGTDPCSTNASRFLISPDACISNQLLFSYQRAGNVDGYNFDLMACDALGDAWSPLAPSAYSSSVSNLADGAELVCVGLDIDSADTNRFYRLQLRAE